MRSYTPAEYIQVITRAVLHAPWFYHGPWRSPAATKAYQEKQIKKLLAHAYSTTELYRRKYQDAGVSPEDFASLSDLEKFPTVTKQEIIDAFPEGAISDTVNQSECIPSVSSGSSGKVITIVHNPKDTWSYALGRFRILNSLGTYKPWDTCLYIYTSPYPAASFLGLYKSYFIPTLNELANTARSILSLKPSIICSYPSHLLALMQHLSADEAQSLRLKLISVGSELSTKAQRATLAKFFNCPVLDEYSSEELGWIAAECEQGSYHLWEDISYIETVTAGTASNLVGTNLHNFAMPFIRYEQGDLGIIDAHNTCACGRTGRVLNTFLGRKNDAFTFTDGRTLTSAYLLDTVYDLLLTGHIDILDFCLIQESADVVRMQVVSKHALSKDGVTDIKSRLERLLGTTVHIDQVTEEQLLKTASGKRNPIISRFTAQANNSTVYK